MNPVFYLLIILGAVALWFFLTFVFKPLGKFFIRLYDDAVDVMSEEDEVKMNKKEQNK